MTENLTKSTKPIQFIQKIHFLGNFSTISLHNKSIMSAARATHFCEWKSYSHESSLHASVCIKVQPIIFSRRFSKFPLISFFSRYPSRALLVSFEGVFIWLAFICLCFCVRDFRMFCERVSNFSFQKLFVFLCIHPLRLWSSQRKSNCLIALFRFGCLYFGTPFTRNPLHWKKKLSGPHKHVQLPDFFECTNCFLNYLIHSFSNPRNCKAI